MKLSGDLALDKSSNVMLLVSDVLLRNMCGEKYNGKKWGLDHRKFGKKYTDTFRKLISQLTEAYVSGELDQDSFREALAGLISYFESERLDSYSLVDVLEKLAPE